MYETYAKLRDRAGMNDYGVSKECGFHPSIISDWKHGKSKPKVDKLQKIAKAIGCDLEELL